MLEGGRDSELNGETSNHIQPVFFLAGCSYSKKLVGKWISFFCVLCLWNLYLPRAPITTYMVGGNTFDKELNS
jgi:hypothetical protein